MHPERPVAPSFDSTASLYKGFGEDRQENEGEGTYARKGYEKLRGREKEVAEMLGVPDTAIFNSGMAALCTALEAEELKPGDIILCGKEAYGQTKAVFASLEKRGIKVIRFNSSDEDELARLLEDENPRLIFLEGVANAPELPVTDLKKAIDLLEETNERYAKEHTTETLLEKYLSSRAWDLSSEHKTLIVESLKEFKGGHNPLVFRPVIRCLEEERGFSRSESLREMARMAKFILTQERSEVTLLLDNTLSSPVLRNPLKEAGETDVNLVVTESGTKHFQGGKDPIMLGVAYSNKEKNTQKIKETRTRLGTFLQAPDEAKLPENIRTVMEETVKKQSKNALQLAQFLRGKRGIAEVIHPNLASHEDHELAERIAPQGLTTLFYVRLAIKEGFDPNTFVDAVKREAGEAVEIGSSFGKAKTRLFPFREGAVRIAAGSEDEAHFKEIEKAFLKVLEASQV